MLRKKEKDLKEELTEGPRSGFSQNRQDIYSKFDRNRDGELQQNEIDLAVVVLRRMDENEDGDVSQSEVVATTST